MRHCYCEVVHAPGCPNHQGGMWSTPADPDLDLGLSWLAKLRHNLRTQDNRYTAHPVFIVQQRERIGGVELDYCDGHEWVDIEDGATPVRDKAEVERLDAHYFEHDDECPDGFIRVGYVDRWQFVTACFTEEGAKAYIAANGHNLRAPRIYVESAYRNEEWQRVTKLLMGDES